MDVQDPGIATRLPSTVATTPGERGTVDNPGTTLLLSFRRQPSVNRVVRRNRRRAGAACRPSNFLDRRTNLERPTGGPIVRSSRNEAGNWHAVALGSLRAAAGGTIRFRSEIYRTKCLHYE